MKAPQASSQRQTILAPKQSQKHAPDRHTAATSPAYHPRIYRYASATICQAVGAAHFDCCLTIISLRISSSRPRTSTHTMCNHHRQNHRRRQSRPPSPPPAPSRSPPRHHHHHRNHHQRPGDIYTQAVACVLVGHRCRHHVGANNSRGGRARLCQPC